MRRFTFTGLLAGLLLASAGALCAVRAPVQAAAPVPLPVAAPTPLPTQPHDFAMPGTQPGALTDPIPNPDQCNICHTPPIYDTWRGSMMGQAGRDPLFWAALAVAEDDAPGSGEFCLRCHTPKGWLEGRSHVTDGSALTDADINAGVACEVCHRLVDPQPPVDATRDAAAALDLAIHATLTTTVPVNRIGSAMMVVDPADNRRGPFVVDAPHTAFQANFQGQGGDPVVESRLCGTCHNIDNPALVWTEEPPGGGPAQFWYAHAHRAKSCCRPPLFPMERTYDEWLNSAYPAGIYAPQFVGAGPTAPLRPARTVTCRQTGEAAYGGAQRDCGEVGCLPAHTLVGGNTWHGCCRMTAGGSTRPGVRAPVASH
ncbi:MAG: multiheme c-type cytochrome [Caldilineaceae bacterium]